MSAASSLKSKLAKSTVNRRSTTSKKTVFLLILSRSGSVVNEILENDIQVESSDLKSDQKHLAFFDQDRNCITGAVLQ